MIKIRIRKRLKMLGAIVVILDEKNRTLILKRPTFTRWEPLKWAYPGGKIEKGETPLEAAVRETKEETNLDVSDLKDINLKLDNAVAAYYTRSYVGEVEIDYEHTDWAWASRGEIEKYDLAPGVLQTYDWVLKNG